MTTITIFALSFLASLSLIAFKAIELRRGNKHFILEFINKLDSRLDKAVNLLKFKCLQLVQSLRYIVSVRGKEVVKEWLIKAEKRLVEEYHKNQDALMGKKEIINRGSVSFYLKKIKEEKENGEKGKIEDSL